MKTLYLSGIVGYEITADKIKEQININSKEKLQVFVNSPGGFVVDAFEIFDLFWAYEGNVEFIICACAASAMSYIIMSGDKISSFKNPIFMGHKTQTYAYGDSDDLQLEAEISRAMDNVIAEAYMIRIKKSKEEILSDMKKEIWLIGWEALTDSGIIDNVIDSPEELEISEDEIRQQIVFANEEIEKKSIKENKENAILKIVECKNKMSKDLEKIKSNSMRAVAMIGGVNKIINNNALKSDDMSDNKNKTEAKMPKLQEFLKSNSEAAAEYERDLQAAEAKGIEIAKTTNQDTVRIDERKRICSILQKSDVKISDVVVEALNKGLSVEQYALAELDNQIELRNNGGRENVFSGLSLKSNQTPGDQDKTSLPPLNDSDVEKKAKAALDKINSTTGGI